MIALAYALLAGWPPVQAPGRTYTWTYTREAGGHAEELTIRVTAAEVRERWTSGGAIVSDDAVVLGDRTLLEYIAQRHSELAADGWRLTRRDARYALPDAADGGWLSGSCSTP
jgi:hypothetical protein